MSVRQLSLAAIAAGALVALSAPAAEAGTATISGKHLLYTAGVSEVNLLTIAPSGSNFTLSDSRSPVTAGAGCTALGPNQVSCPGAGLTLMIIDAGDLNDDVTNQTALASRLTGGGGNDHLTGGAGNGTVIRTHSGD